MKNIEERINIDSLNDFPQNALKFLKNLEKNNNREWFEENRTSYEENFLKPAQAFVEEVGFHLKDISEEFQAIPQIDKSIFRLHRDVRFSKNKDPYKTNLGLLFWEGNGKKLESSGLYFHIEPKTFFIAVGMHQFTKEQLQQYREIVSIEANGQELKSILTEIEKLGYKIGGDYYKRIPRSFNAANKFSDLLLKNSLYAFKEEKISKLRNIDPINFTLKTFDELKALHDWLMNNIL